MASNVLSLNQGSRAGAAGECRIWREGAGHQRPRRSKGPRRGDTNRSPANGGQARASTLITRWGGRLGAAGRAVRVIGWDAEPARSTQAGDPRRRIRGRPSRPRRRRSASARGGTSRGDRRYTAPGRRGVRSPPVSGPLADERLAAAPRAARARAPGDPAHDSPPPARGAPRHRTRSPPPGRSPRDTRARSPFETRSFRSRFVR